MIYPPDPGYPRLFNKFKRLVENTDHYRPPNAGPGALRPRVAEGTITFPAQASITDDTIVVVPYHDGLTSFGLDTVGDGPPPSTIWVNISGDVTAEQVRDTFYSIADALSPDRWTLTKQGTDAIHFVTKGPCRSTAITSTDVDILCEGMSGGSYGTDCIPIRWGLSRGVFARAELTC